MTLRMSEKSPRTIAELCYWPLERAEVSCSTALLVSGMQEILILLKPLSPRPIPDQTTDLLSSDLLDRIAPETPLLATTSRSNNAGPQLDCTHLASSLLQGTSPQQQQQQQQQQLARASGSAQLSFLEPRAAGSGTAGAGLRRLASWSTSCILLQLVLVNFARARSTRRSSLSPGA